MVEHQLPLGPGLYRGLAEHIYHSDPTEHGSLSVTRAKILLAEGGPAKYRYLVDNPPAPSPVFDFGSAAHQLVLGGGADVQVIDEDSYRTKRAQEARDAAHAAGKTPILASQWQQVCDMAEQLTQHEAALDILTSGETEVSAFLIDPATGVMMRGRFDHISAYEIGDYKTTADASPTRFERAVWDYGYHIQAAWYRRLAAELGLGTLPFLFVAQEKTAPYLVSVFELDREYLAAGERAMRDALTVYQQCQTTGKWPGYSPNIITLSPPMWARTPQSIPDDLLAELDLLTKGETK